MINFVRKAIRKIGYDLIKTENFSGSYNPFSTVLPDHKIIDLEALGNIALSIPGMISTKSGQILYSLCYLQELEGDVVEIGSWQGRSTSFLARAVSNAENGKFYAIDHFKGNVGKEQFYVVNNKDLSDLKSGFLSNIQKIKLNQVVNLLDLPNDKAAKELKGTTIRFLFIDGDHTKAGVEKDIALFFPFLTKGSIVAFDDFASNVPELVGVIDKLLKENKFSRIMSYHRTLILKV